MSLGNFNVGRDASAVVIAPNGTRIDLSGMVDYSWKPLYKDASSDPLNAPPMKRFLPAGHTLDISIDRNGPGNDALFAQIEDGWWNVGSADPGTSNNGTVYLYINELNGGQTVHQFSGVAMKLSSGGDFKTDTAVKQKIECFAQRWTKVA
jgi:hypothetical protein